MSLVPGKLVRIRAGLDKGKHGNIVWIYGFGNMVDVVFRPAIGPQYEKKFKRGNLTEVFP